MPSPLPQVIRANAAAAALGAPKVVSQKAQPAGKMPRFLNKGTGKMETAQQMKASRTKALAPSAPQRAPKAPAQVKTPAKPAASAAARAPAAKSWLEMNPGEIQKLASSTVSKDTQAELVPYRQRQGEISGTEGTVAKRYGAYGEATDKLLSGIQETQANSAKTFDNQAADAVTKSQGEVNTTGQNAITNNAGYEDPQLRAQLASEQGAVTNIGAAGQANANALGQNEANTLATIRAAAAQRVAEGQRGIASTFGKQRGETQAKEGELLAKEGGASQKLDTELLQKQFTNQAAEAGLKVKVGTLGVDQENAATKAQAVKASEQNNTTKNSIAAEKLKLQAGKLGFEEWAKREKLPLEKMSIVDKARYEKAEIRVKEQALKGKPPNPKEGRKYMSEIATAATIAKAQGVYAGKTGKALAKAKQKAEQAIVKAAKGATVNREIVEAAMNVAYYGRLSTADQAVAMSYGLTQEIRPEWFAKG
jgi:hypothetical protein